MTTFGTYDFETYDWTKPLCCGLYIDDQNRDFFIQRQQPIAVAVQCLQLMASYAAIAGVKVWWAHNGGKFDALFLINAIQTLAGWKCEGYIASGRVISLKVWTDDDVTFELKDSFAVIQSALADALESFGIPHKKVFTKADYKALETDPRAMLKHSDEKLEAGCMADCKALHALLEKTRGMFEEWGGQLKSTFSASALSVLKASIIQPLPTHKLNQWANDVCRNAYHGGRVEVFQHTPTELLSEHDVTSSYPWSMTQDLPLELLGWGEPNIYAQDIMSVIHATVTVPQQAVPPLPYVPVTGGLFFPVGRWSGWFTGVELRYAIEQCGVNATFHEAINYTRGRPFADFVNKVFADKQQATGARREFDKLVLNGCYGKFGQKPESKTLTVFGSREEAIDWERSNSHRSPEKVSLDGTALSVKTYRWPKQTHYALASHVTAYSRMLLHQHLVRAQNNALSYCDTDSIHAHQALALPVANELGGLALKHTGYSASFYAPKLYCMDLNDAADTVLFKSKGFPVSAEAFKRIVQGEKVGNPRGRMQLVKTQLKRGAGVIHLEEDETAKAWSGRSAKRRCVGDANGSTTPWNVAQLQDGEHLEHFSPIAPERHVKPRR